MLLWTPGIDKQRLIRVHNEFFVWSLNVQRTVEHIERFDLFIVIVIAQSRLLTRREFVDTKTEFRILIFVSGCDTQ